MSRALVLGANGQDGSYLVEALLRRGHEVVGVGRDPASRYVPAQPGFTYRGLNLADDEALVALVKSAQPDHAYHFAAVHGATGAGFTYETHWREMMRVNVLALHVLLEHARTHNPRMRVVYAGSAKIFPAPLVGDIDEATPARATCLYGVGKLASRDLLTQYRRDHGVRGSNLILFNHDSARRPRQYLVPTLAQAIARARRDPGHQIAIKTLDFRIDWSAADEFMDLVADIGTAADVSELVMASGNTVHARPQVEALFARYGLDAQAHLIEELPRHDPGPEFRVRIDRLEATARRPSKTVFDVVGDILAANPEWA
jgi:GDPmannose 4,6-dehydratase